jgi:hypothetical protein
MALSLTPLTMLVTRMLRVDRNFHTAIVTTDA